MVGGRARKFFEQALGIDTGQITGQITGRFFHWSMLLAWGLTDSAYRALPRDEQVEMAMFWRWKHEMERQLREQAEMERRGGVGP